MPRRGSDDDVHRITGVRPGLSADIDGRTRRYLISMGVRTLCFLGAVVASGWLRWTLLGAALVLPYVAVVIANAGRESSNSMPQVPLDPNRRVLLPPERQDRD